MLVCCAIWLYCYGMVGHSWEIFRVFDGFLLVLSKKKQELAEVREGGGG